MAVGTVRRRAVQPVEDPDAPPARLLRYVEAEWPARLGEHRPCAFYAASEAWRRSHGEPLGRVPGTRGPDEPWHGDELGWIDCAGTRYGSKEGRQ